MRLTVIAVAGAAFLTAGLAAADELARREKAAEAVAGAFLGELGGALKKELSSGTPAGAIGVCSEQAPSIASRLSRENGWRVTRVGTRVRNPMLGTPDTWEQRILQVFGQRLAAGEPLAQMQHSEVVAEPGGSYYRYMKAIGVQPACLACHGSATDIDPAVAQALTQRYPYDRATGYRQGELRGAISIKQPMDVALRPEASQ